MGRRPRRAQRPLCGRAPVSSETVGQGCHRLTGDRERGAPRSVSGSDHPRGCRPPKGEGRFGESLGRGNPKGARGTGRGNTARCETRERSKASWSRKHGLRFTRPTARRQGSLVTGHPLSSRTNFEGERATGGMSGRFARADRTGRKPANPRTGCGVQQTREAVCGANHRSREERQGWNVFGCGNPEPRATESGRTQRCRWRGDL